MNYFAPCLLLLPNFDGVIDLSDFRLHRRAWQVSTFDLATLATKHKLHLPYQLMDVFLSGPAHIEIEVVGASNNDEAVAQLEIFRAMLYLNGLSPFLIPYVATHSFNDYAGLNSRDSPLLAPKLPEGMRSGITSTNATVEVWPLELSLMTLQLRNPKGITAEIAGKAAWQFRQWQALEHKYPELSAVRYALTTAPQITHLGSSLLHLWTGLESLFPNVKAEVSFRISLLLAALASPITPAQTTYAVAKHSYTKRSNAAHGNLKRLTYDDWHEAWGLLCTCLEAVIRRGDLPDETDLLSAMLGKSTF